MLAELLTLLPALLLAGAIAGLMAGLLGVGGGIVMVPVLFETFVILGVPDASAILIATGTSLSVIVPTAIASTRSHADRGNVDWVVFKRWAPPMVFAVTFGAVVAPYLADGPLLMLFGGFAVLAALNHLLRRDAAPLRDELPSVAAQWLIAMIIGVVCVLLGIGAGTLGVAVMSACSVAMHRAVGTAAALGLMIAIPGALVGLFHATPAGATPYTAGHVSLPGFLCMAPLAVLCAPLGVRVGARLSEKLLQQVFAGFLLVVGLRMLSRAF